MKGNVKKMVNLRAIPYNLNDADIAWVENTIASMTDEEKENLQKFLQESYENSEYHTETGQGLYNGSCARCLL